VNAIQERIKTQLLLNTWFTGVEIITADDGDIENELDRRLSPLDGLAITILIPVGANLDPVSNLVAPKLIVEVTASEKVTINRSAGGLNKRAYDAIRKIMAPVKPDGTGGLHFWEPDSPFSRLEFQEFGEFGAKTKGGKSLLLYRALFETTEIIG
jgi:hypothetical protein